MDRARMGQPVTLRGLVIANRVWMSPMCQYSAGRDGVPTDWHMVHYGSRAVGGAGIVMVESTAVGPRHRTTDQDLGLWAARQVDGHRALVAHIKAFGSVAAVQLNSAGRKSSHMVPGVQGGQNRAVSVDDGGWVPLAPSARPFGNLAVPAEMTTEDIDDVVNAFAAAARNAGEAGYDIVDVHAAHGYLLHQFLSPVSNGRSDAYGGSLENRMRLPLRVCQAVRDTFPQDRPVFVRLTAKDWIDGGITLEESTIFARRLAAVGIDLLDVTSGALAVDTPPPAKPALNLEFAEALKEATGIAAAPVGQLGDPQLLDQIFAGSNIDAVILGRALLRDPYFPLKVAPGPAKNHWPLQYHRAL